MKCYVHPDTEATAVCTRCGRAVCADCAVNVGGRIVCRECVAGRVVAHTAAVAVTQAPQSELNTMAIVSALVALVGLLACVCAGGIGGLPVGAAAAVLGYLGRKQIAEGPSSPNSMLLANIGIGLGVAEVILSLASFVLLGGITFLSILSSAGSGG